MILFSDGGIGDTVVLVDNPQGANRSSFLSLHAEGTDLFEDLPIATVQLQFVESIRSNFSYSLGEAIYHYITAKDITPITLTCLGFNNICDRPGFSGIDAARDLFRRYNALDYDSLLQLSVSRSVPLKCTWLTANYSIAQADTRLAQLTLQFAGVP